MSDIDDKHTTDAPSPEPATPANEPAEEARVEELNPAEFFAAEEAETRAKAKAEQSSGFSLADFLNAQPPTTSEPALAADGPPVLPSTAPEVGALPITPEPEAPAASKSSARRKAEAAAEVEAADYDEDEWEDEEQEPLIRAVPDDGIARRWYALHAHSGQEGNVKAMLLVGAEQQGLDNLVTNVLVPMEEVAEVRSGQKKVSKRKFFPGYVLIQLPEHPQKFPELWHLIKETPGVTGFIGSRTAPVPLDDAEVNAIVEEIRGERERPRPKVKFQSGERVKIIDGPFANFLGSIDEINEERGTLKVMVEIFERLTSVEVEFWQVEQN